MAKLKRLQFASALVIITAVVVGCSTDGRVLKPVGPGQGESIAIIPPTTEPAHDQFANEITARFSVTGPWAEGLLIDNRHTCLGESVSPELVIANVPQDAKGLAIILTELAYPEQPLWVVANIDPIQTVIHEGQSPFGAINGAVASPGSKNSGTSQEIIDGYSGPCVTDSDVHQFQLSVFALSQPIEFVPEPLSLDSTQLLIQAIHAAAFDTAETIFIVQTT